jgi:hypothetical protein
MRSVLLMCLTVVIGCGKPVPDPAADAKWAEYERDRKKSAENFEKRKQEWYATHQPDPTPVNVGDTVILSTDSPFFVNLNLKTWKVIAVNGDYYTITPAGPHEDVLVEGGHPVKIETYKRAGIQKLWVPKKGRG